MAPLDNNPFSYSRENNTSFSKKLGYRLYEMAYGFTEATIRQAFTSAKIPYMAPISGYSAELITQMLYSKFFAEGNGNTQTSATYEYDDTITGYKPLISKEIFVRDFKNDFVNANKFYIEFLGDINPVNKAVLSSYDVKYNTKPSSGEAFNNFSELELSKNDNYKILLNYMVDSIQLPNFNSKKTKFTRLGQDFDFVNNQQYEGDLTINITYDLRANMDRLLQYMAQYSKYYSVMRSNKFDIRITSYKPMHDNYMNATDYTFNIKTFHNIQLSSMQNYQLDNKGRDFINRAITFSFMDMTEKIYDPIHDILNPELVYNMYSNFYNWATKDLKITNVIEDELRLRDINFEIKKENEIRVKDINNNKSNDGSTDLTNDEGMA